MHFVVDYIAKEVDEISLEKGDLIFVEYKGDDNWFEGLNITKNLRGMFPGNFVTQLSANGLATRHSAASAHVFSPVSSQGEHEDSHFATWLRVSEDASGSAFPFTPDLDHERYNVCQLGEVQLSAAVKRPLQDVIKEGRSQALFGKRPRPRSFTVTASAIFVDDEGIGIQRVTECGYDPNAPREFAIVIDGVTAFVMECETSAVPLMNAISRAFTVLADVARNRR